MVLTVRLCATVVGCFNIWVCMLVLLLHIGTHQHANLYYSLAPSPQPHSTLESVIYTVNCLYDDENKSKLIIITNSRLISYYT